MQLFVEFINTHSRYAAGAILTKRRDFPKVSLFTFVVYAGLLWVLFKLFPCYTEKSSKSIKVVCLKCNPINIIAVLDSPIKISDYFNKVYDT